MKKLILIILLVGIVISAKAQNTENQSNTSEARNTLYASFGGSGIFFSGTYERLLTTQKQYRFGLKGGIGSSFSSVLFPHEFNFSAGAFFLYGRQKHHLDISASATGYILEQYSYVENKTSHELKFLFVPSVCYRYQKRTGGFTGRIGISPVINFNSVTNSFTPWLDVSLGWGF